MKYRTRIILISCILLVNNVLRGADVEAYKTIQPPTIDGLANESCWQEATWVALDQVWVGRTPTPENCSARYKACWNGSKIYILMEVTDDILVNWHPTEPLNNYPANDCPEIFIDENNSGGEHERSYNAFAYHISTLYDVVDIDEEGSPKLYNDHIEVKRTKSGTIYTWEMALTVYTDKFVYGATNNITASLTAGKVLGFTAAYNDSDTKFSTRETMLASVEIEPWTCSNLGYTSSGVNCSWQTASVFGKMTLRDVPLQAVNGSEISGLTVTRADSGIHIFGNNGQEQMTVKFYDMQGRLVHERKVESEYLAVEGLKKGNIYTIVLELPGAEHRYKMIW